MNTSRFTLFALLLVLATTLTGCDAIGSIFKAGAYTGIIVAVIVVALVLYVLNKMRGPRV